MASELRIVEDPEPMAGIGPERRNGLRGHCAPIALALLLAAVLFFVSLGWCRRENVSQAAACPPVDDHPELAFWLGVALPALVLLAAGAVRAPTYAAWALLALTWAVWVGYVIAVLAS
jgi:hypothetical protein